MMCLTWREEPCYKIILPLLSESLCLLEDKFIAIYTRVSSCDDEAFEFLIFSAVLSDSLSTVISWTANCRFHGTANF